MSLTPAMQAVRKGRVTATRIAAIMGLTATSALEVALSAKSESGRELDPSWPLWFGNALERPVAEAYAVATGTIVFPVKATFVHPDEDWMAASPDAIVCDPVEDVGDGGHCARSAWTHALPLTDPDDGVLCGLELKTAGHYDKVQEWGGATVSPPPTNPTPEYYEAVQRIAEANGDRVPYPYLVQVLWCMEVCQLDRWDVAVLLADHGFQYRQFCVRRTKDTQALIDILKERGREFWKHYIQGDEVPEPDGSQSAGRALSGMYQQADRDIVCAMGDEAEWLAEYPAADAAFKEAERERETLKQLIIGSIGSHEGIETTDGAHRATWKANKNGHRTFRFKGE